MLLKFVTTIGTTTEVADVVTLATVETGAFWPNERVNASDTSAQSIRVVFFIVRVF